MYFRSAYMHYVMENMGKIRAALTAEKGDDFKQRDIMSKLGEGWQSMNDDAKAPYAAKAAAAKEHYSIEIEVRCCMCTRARPKKELEGAFVKTRKPRVRSAAGFCACPMRLLAHGRFRPLTSLISRFLVPASFEKGLQRSQRRGGGGRCGGGRCGGDRDLILVAIGGGGGRDPILVAS